MITYVNSAQANSGSNGNVSTISVTLSGVTAGHFIRLGFAGYGFPSSITVSDGVGGVYNVAAFNNNGGNMLGEWFGIVPVSGTVTWTFTVNQNSYLSCTVVEYSFASVGIIFTSVIGTNGNGVSLDTGSIAFSAAGSWMIAGIFGVYANTTWTAVSPSTLRIHENLNNGYSIGMTDDITTNASSPVNPSITLGGSGQWNSFGIAYLEAPVNYSFSVSPTSIPQASSSFPVTVTGDNTSWNSVTPWSISGVAGVTVSHFVTNSPTSVTIYCTTGFGTGTLVISDGTFKQSVTVVPGTRISQAYINRSNLAIFIAESASSNQPVPITAVNNDPIIAINGHNVTLSPHVFCDQSFSSPILSYIVEYGSAKSILVQNGGFNYTAPVATAPGLVLGTPTLVNGGITSITATGMDTQGGILVAGGTGTGFVGFYTVATPGTLSAITCHVDKTGSGYTIGSTPIAVQAYSQPAGIAFTATVSDGIINTIPIISAGSALLAAPPVTITDSTGTGALAATIMSGPLPSDNIVYSVPMDWLTSPVGTIAAATNAAMGNYINQNEPWFEAIVPTMPIGMNWAYPWGVIGGLHTCQQNWLQTAGNWTGAGNPGVAVSDSTGSQAVILAIVNSSGVITGFQVLCGGSNYTAPTITISTPAPGGVTATLGSGGITVVGGVITAVAFGSGGQGGSGYAGSTIDGKPIAINDTTNLQGGSGGFPCAYVLFCANGYTGDGITLHGMPDIVGHWTVTLDETNPSNPMIIQIYAHGLVNGTITHGSIVGGVEIGKKWDFYITRRSTFDYGINLSLVVTGPTVASSAAWTLQNMFLTAPDATGAAVQANRLVPLAPDQNGVKWMSSPTQNKGAEAIRFSLFGDYQWDCGAVLPSDLRPANDFTWSDGGQRYRYMVVKNIRQYSLDPVTNPGWHSPYIFTQENYPGTLPSSGIGGGPAPYYWVPPINIDTWIPPCILCFEMETVSAHGLSTGHRIYIPNDPLTAALPVYDYNTNPTSTLTVNIQSTAINDAYWQIWVTSPTTFIVMMNYVPSTYTGGPHVMNCNGSNPCNILVTFDLIQQNSLSFPYELACETVNAIPGCGFWCMVPLMANDACVTAIAQRVRDTIALGRKVYVEWVDEHWNFGATDYYPIYTMSYLAGGNASINVGDQNAMYAWRSGTIHNIFKTVFNQQDINGNTNRGGSVVCLYGGQEDNALCNIAIINYLNRYNVSSAGLAAPFEAHAFLCASYWNIPQDIGLVNAAAATYSNFKSSSKYGTSSPWTMEQYMDLMKHLVYFQMGYNMPAVPLVWAGGNNSVISLYNLVAGQTQPPVIINYEASVSCLIGPGPSNVSWMLRTYLAHDIWFHPYNADVEYAYYAGIQLAGVQLAMMNPIISGPNPYGNSGSANVSGQNDGVAATNWQYATWEGMPYGRGDGSLDEFNRPFVNLSFNKTGLPQHISNVSSKLAGFQEWINGTVPSAPPNPVITQTSLKHTRWFPGLR